MNNMYEKIEDLCNERGISLTRLSKDTGVPRSVFSELKSGRTKQLSNKHLPMVAAYLGVSVDFLLGRETEKASTLVFMNPIRKIRTEAGLSQIKFANMLNVHQTAVSQWEQGRTTPDVEIAKRISELFNVSLDTVLDNPYIEKAPTQEDERKITLDDFTFAMQNETKDLTDGDKQLLISMARQLNDARKKKNGESE